MKKDNLIIIYTGNGKGKTKAALGLADDVSDLWVGNPGSNSSEDGFNHSHPSTALDIVGVLLPPEPDDFKIGNMRQYALSEVIVESQCGNVEQGGARDFQQGENAEAKHVL